MRAPIVVLLLVLLPSIAGGSPYWVPSEDGCLPIEDSRPPERPADRPAAADPSATHLSMPIGTDVPAAVLVWDEGVHSRANGTVRPRDAVRCDPEHEAPPVRTSPFDVNPQ